MAEKFFEMLKEWEGSTITIINPQSFSISKLGVKTSLEHYQATVAGVTSEYLRLTFVYKKADEEESVEQYIPITWIKRASIWGDEKYVQL